MVTDGLRDICFDVAAILHVKELLICHMPDAHFGWVADIWSPNRDAPGPLAAHKKFVARLRLKGIMQPVWAERHGAVPAPMKPPIDAPDPHDGAELSARPRKIPAVSQEVGPRYARRRPVMLWGDSRALNAERRLGSL
jgi:hypothetical protein